MGTDPSVVTRLYAMIPLEAMQQVSDSYMAWYVDRETRSLDEKIAKLRSDLRENDSQEESFRPSASELNAIERLQRDGVNSMDLLDRMVEQGEEWLILTMHRLDHFEKTGLAPKDYSTWCEHALGGAYDWIDHDRLGAAPKTPTTSNPSAPAQSATRQPTAPNMPSSGSWQNTPTNQGEDRATQPVPSVAPRWGETSYPGINTPNNDLGAPGGPEPTDPGNESGRRNIFRIFTN